jgi:tungstate transport system substrate-binding protein
MTTALAAVIIAAITQFSDAASPPAERFITVASTTSTENSGLFGHILPLFKDRTNIDVHVVALGTGQALDVGKRGDADVVFVHDTDAELKFVSEGFGVGRREVMYNDFVLIGPQSDPAHVAGMSDIAAALKAIPAANAPFVSRGDRSGTHTAELRLWNAAGIDIASAMDAYLLADRGTWLAFQNRGKLRILVEGDPRLFNQYGVILINPERHPHVKRADAQAFVDWLVSPEGQAAIGSFRIGGEQAFFRDANGTRDRTQD